MCLGWREGVWGGRGDAGPWSPSSQERGVTSRCSSLPAPAAGPAGRGAGQAGDHGGAEQHRRGEWHREGSSCSGVRPCGAVMGIRGLYCCHKPRAGPLRGGGVCHPVLKAADGLWDPPQAGQSHGLGSSATCWDGVGSREELGMLWVAGAGGVTWTVHPPQLCSPPHPRVSSHRALRRSSCRKPEGCRAWLRPSPPGSGTICSFSFSSSSFSISPTTRPPSR